MEMDNMFVTPMPYLHSPEYIRDVREHCRRLFLERLDGVQTLSEMYQLYDEPIMTVAASPRPVDWSQVQGPEGDGDLWWRVGYRVMLFSMKSHM